MNDNNLRREKMSPDDRRKRLLDEANRLPMRPGVYIMHGDKDKVIYVGKSRKLRDRVSQYFRCGEKNIKTAKMVSSVEWFEYILCDTEIEALTLENTLIKKYSPRYNIKLKDAKSYPYIKVSPGEFPRLTMTRKRDDDGGRYFGPYSGTSTVFSVINLINKTFGLPTCKRKFPEDIGKERPCLYYQIGQCRAPCNGNVKSNEYKELIDCACDVLRGNTASARRILEEKMFRYADAEEFEAAAVCRDTIHSLEMLSQKQKVVASPETEQDVCGVFSDGVTSAMSLLCIRGGALIDKMDYVIGREAIVDSYAVSSLLCDHYKNAGIVPKRILLGFECEPEDIELLSSYLASIAGRHIAVSVPERGDGKKLCDLANDNAKEAVQRYNRDNDKNEAVMVRLAGLLKLEVLPERIEAYDISNLGDEHITAGMIVSLNGRFQKKDYRSFKIKTTDGADDYGAMREALTRRLARLSDDDGSFASAPDLLLIDGGSAHLNVALEIVKKYGLNIPVAGMVKDDFHKTRSLVTSEGELSIAGEKDVFTFIYRIQEEVHRFTVSQMSKAKRKTYRVSTLEKINGIGPKKSKLLLSALGGLSGVKNAEIDVLKAVNGITDADASAVYAFFHS